MDPRNSEHVERFRTQLETWQDGRFISREAIESLAMFSLYLVNLADADGWVYVGHSFKRGVGLSKLVIKAMLDEQPVVSFISGRTLVSCITIFLRRMEEKSVEWHPDKYG